MEVIKVTVPSTPAIYVTLTPGYVGQSGYSGYSGSLASGFTTLPPIHSTNEDAVSAGMSVGQIYRSGGNPDYLCIVH